MIRTILYNLKKRIILFLTNKTNNEYLSKIYINQIHKKIIESKKNEYALSGFKVYSQNEEDGIIEAIFKDIGTLNKLFCEIGIGNTIENNTHYLILKDWKGLWIDRQSKFLKKLSKKISNNQKKLEMLVKKITPENINNILKKSIILAKATNSEIDFLSIDIDSYDLNCISSLEAFSPRLICIEYNAKIRLHIKLDIKNIENFSWEYDDYFGSSLKSVDIVMKKKGYILIATNITGSNAFYVKKELIDKCKTKGQSIEDLYSPPNFELYNFNVSHAPTNKYLIDKINE